MAEATVSTHALREHGGREYKFPMLIFYCEPGKTVNYILTQMRLTLQKPEKEEIQSEQKESVSDKKNFSSVEGYKISVSGDGMNMIS